MKKIFISAPFTNTNPWRMRLNIQAAEEMALAVWREGAFAMCPHMNSGIFFGTLDEATVIQGYCESMVTHDAVWFHHDWWLSTGCKAEMEAARAANMLIFTNWADLKKWLDNTGS